MNRILRSTPYGDLVATESSADGNCFYHSYLQAVEGESFLRSNQHEKVMQLKKYVANKITPEHVYTMSAPVNFELIKSRIDNFLTKNNIKPLEYNSSDFSIKGYLVELEKVYSTLISSKEFVDHVHKIIHQYGTQLKQMIGDHGVWANDTTLPLFCDIMKVDITFISAADLKPIQLVLKKPFEHHLMMLHSVNHFEPLGIQSGTTVYRVLSEKSIDKIVKLL